MWWPFGLLLGATRFGLLSPVALTFIIDKTTNINIFFLSTATHGAGVRVYLHSHYSDHAFATA